MEDKSDKDIDNLVERGNPEKDQIKQRCLKKHKTKIASFFKDFRDYCKYSSSNGKEELILLKNELEKTLTNADKEFLMKQWKPVASPIILLPSMDQYNELRNYINGFDLNRAMMQPKPTYIPAQHFLPATTSNGFYQPGPQNIYNVPSTSLHNGALYARNDVQTLPGSSFQYSMDYLNGGITRSHADDNSSPELPEDTVDPDVESLSESIGPMLGFGNDKEDDFNEETDCSILINDLFNELSEIIQNNGDLMAAIDLIKKNHEKIVYESILKFCTKEREPLTFQIAINLARYRPVLDNIYADGLFNLDQRNVHDLTIFYFLIQTDIESLYTFLKFTRDKSLQEEVHKICLSDKFFREALSTKKREMANQSIQRRRLESMEKFCMVIDNAIH